MATQRASKNSTVARGSAFEDMVFSYLSDELREGRLGFHDANSRIRGSPKYYSADRGSDISFDLSIEVSMSGSESVSYLVLVECKDYSGSVPVDDLEEFNSKVVQVSGLNVKAIFISTAPLQAGALNYARSRKIAVARYFHGEGCKWELRRRVSSSV